MKLLEVADDEVRYQFSLLTNVSETHGVLSVSVQQGEVAFEQPDVAAREAWMKELASSLVRAAWRGREQYGWPRRITRWRPEPRARI